MIPVLMLTHNRLKYTREAIIALDQCKGIELIIIDNGSTDGTQDYLRRYCTDCKLIFNDQNKGIAYAMNQFLEMTTGYAIAAKVDNDTVVPPYFFTRMVDHLAKADIVQAKHKLIEASAVGTFDQWVARMPGDDKIRYNHFVGGSGILLKRQLVHHIPETEWVLGGWREFQRRHPEIKKAFALDCEIKLLDEHGYEDFPEYYQQTGRITNNAN